MIKTPIIRLCRGQPELAVRIVQPGCDGGQLAHTAIQLVLRSPHCGCPMLSPWKIKGCWPGYHGPRNYLPSPHEEQLKLVYPAYSLDDDLNVVFRFDNKLFDLRPGRYEGLVEFRDGTEIMYLDIDLCNTPFIIDKVSVNTVTCTEEGSCT